MKFKVGDQVVVKTTRHLTGHIGEVIGSSLMFGVYYYDVSFPTSGIHVFEEAELEYPTTTTIMSQGLKNWLGVPDISLDDYGYNPDKVDTLEPKCDCGGFKTFGSMSEENHSSWCSSRQTKVDAGLVIEVPILGPSRTFILKGFNIP